MNHNFDSDTWIQSKQLELVNLIFKNEFQIEDFRKTTKVINFDDLQTHAMKDKINTYRKALGIVFKSEDIRSVLDYYYLQQDKKPVLNLLKQILRFYGYEFKRTSEYQGNLSGKKVYKSKYTIVKSKTVTLIPVSKLKVENSSTTVPKVKSPVVPINPIKPISLTLLKNPQSQPQPQSDEN